MLSGMAKLFRTVLAVAVTLFVAVTALQRVRELAASQPPAAVGEKRWMDWAYRWGMADPLRDAGRQLRPGEPVELVVHHPIFEEGWWKVMARYYLPSHRVVAIRRAADPTPPQHHTLVVVDEESVQVVRGK